MREKILLILADIRPEFDFENENDFINNEMLDSLDLVNLVVSLDKTFNISIDGMDIVPGNFTNVDSILSLLKKNGVNIGS